MKTIKERAKEFALGARDMHCGNCDTCSTKSEDYRRYADIATKQRDIDIGKACEANRNELRRVERLFFESTGVPASLMPVDKSLSEIIREMEEYKYENDRRKSKTCSVATIRIEWEEWI